MEEGFEYETVKELVKDVDDADDPDVVEVVDGMLEV